jgi:hypothetical protein
MRDTRILNIVVPAKAGTQRLFGNVTRFPLEFIPRFYGFCQAMIRRYAGSKGSSCL